MLPRLDGKKDDAGAIVGFVDGDVTGCYFIDEGLSGISGMNLEGRAEAVKPDDMTTSDGSFPSRMPLLDNGNFYMADGDKFLPQIKSLAQNGRREYMVRFVSQSQQNFQDFISMLYSRIKIKN